MYSSYCLFILNPFLSERIRHANYSIDAKSNKKKILCKIRFYPAYVLEFIFGNRGEQNYLKK